MNSIGQVRRTSKLIRKFDNLLVLYLINFQFFNSLICASNLAETVNNGFILEICICLGASNLAKSRKFNNLLVLYFINFLVLYFIPERPAEYEIKNCSKMQKFFQFFQFFEFFNSLFNTNPRPTHRALDHSDAFFNLLSYTYRLTQINMNSDPI